MDLNLLMNNKLTMHQLLLEDQQLSPYLPETAPFSESNLKNFLKDQRTVILKPVAAHSGVGVMKLRLTSKLRIKIHIEDTTRRFHSFSSALCFLTRTMNSTPYLVQQYIPLTKVDQVPFDLRVIIQRKIGYDWKVTAKFARFAKEHHFVTTSGHKRVHIPLALQWCQFSDDQIARLTADIQRVSLRIGACLGAKFPNHHIYGIDLGIDRKGRLAIIEVNYKPYVDGIKRFDAYMYRQVRGHLAFNQNYKKS